MRIQPQIIKDRFGNHYCLYIQGSAPGHGLLRAERFSDSIFTENFVRGCRVPMGFWRRVLTRVGVRNFKYRASEEKKITQLLARATIKLYRAKHLDQRGKTSEPLPVIATTTGTTYTLEPVSVLLVEPESEIKILTDKKQAVNFLTELNMDDAQRNELATAIGIPEADKNQTPDVQIAAIAQTLLNRELVLLKQQPKVKPPKRTAVEDLPTQNVDSKPATLGPHEEAGYSNHARQTVESGGIAASSMTEKETPPLCQRNSLTVSCSHGRSVTLDSDTPYIPSLDVVASSKGGKQLDTITIESNITDICPSHTSAHLAIGREMVRVNHTQPGKTSSFRACAETLNIQSNPVKYAWLPRIKPKTFPIYPGATCDNSKFKGAGKNIQLNIYPKVAWDWSITLGYGKDQHSLEENEKSKGSYKKALSQKRFSIDGHIKLTQDNETFELGSQFKKAIESTTQQIEAVTQLVEGAISRFDEGKKPKVTVTWPNLKLNLKTELTEGKGPYRTVAFDFSISATPFFGLSVEVDILPVLAKPLDGGIISKWLIEEAQASLKKGIGSERGLYSLKGEVSVILKGSGALGCDAHFQGDFSNNNNRIEKVSGKPMETKIEFSAEGKVDVKGHLLKINVELVAGIGIKSGLTLGLEIDSDERGYYWQPQTKFNGVKVYITKFVKVKKDSGGGSGWGVEEVATSLTTIKETNEHIWIEEKSMITSKHYFIEY